MTSENLPQNKNHNESTSVSISSPLKRPFYTEKDKRFIWALNYLANHGKVAETNLINLSAELIQFKKEVSLDIDETFEIMSNISQWTQQINFVQEVLHLKAEEFDVNSRIFD